MSWKRDIAIFKEEGSYSCFPTLEQLPDGCLVVAVTQREWPSHSSQGRMRVLVSQDGGKSWEETHDRALPALWPGATGKFRCVLGDGTWLDMGAGGWGGDFDAPEVLPIGQRAEWEAKRYCTRDCENDPGLFYLSGKDLHIGKSRAGGATWQRQAIPAPEEMVNLNGFRGLRLRDGTLLFPVGGAVDHPGLDLRAVEGAVWRQYVARSTDDGATWEWAQMIEDPCGVYTEEVTLLEVADNRLLAMVRCHRPGPTGYLWQQWSEDGGKSWSQPVETPVWGYPCHLLKLQDGRLLCTYGYRFKPAGIRAVLSEDKGWSWDVQHERILRDDGGTPARGWGPEQLAKFAERGVAGADLGYPFSAQLADGAILTVYYFTGSDGITHAAATRWSIDGDL